MQRAVAQHVQQVLRSPHHVPNAHQVSLAKTRICNRVLNAHEIVSARTMVPPHALNVQQVFSALKNQQIAFTVLKERLQ
jgi:hypothetical protein